MPRNFPIEHDFTKFFADCLIFTIFFFSLHLALVERSAMNFNLLLNDLVKLLKMDFNNLGNIYCKGTNKNNVRTR